MLGILGQILLLIAFVACGLAGFAFFREAQDPEEPVPWQRIARTSWNVLGVAVIGASAILWYLLLTHQFQYAYVYQNTSLDLPTHFLVSAFWAGQAGSFLLWTLFMSLLGFALIRWTRRYEAPVMTVVAVCQFFLLSMIVGVQIGALPIGSSPFMSLAEKFPEAPVFQTDPSFVPADGTGLNDLLQNYWMAIHPPTLFVGFTAMIVPFAFAIAALWKKRYTEWVRPALPWTLFGVMVLGLGIALGGYWAYETLSFGGYWAWDPVENSSLVPWLVGIAAIHAMLIQKKSGRGHKAALFLSILAYMFVVYSTFLTRSGILGDVSVHSFVDLGLYNQLVLWILTMGVAGFGLFAYRYRALPAPKKEPHLLSREFTIFSGAMLLCAIAAVIILGTSSPIFGRLFRDAPATVPVEFYNKWTLPLTVGLVFLAGLGQLFWWNKMSVENVNRVLMKPIALAVVSTVAVLVLTPFVEYTVQMTAPEATTQPMAEAGLLSGLGAFWGTYGAGLLMLLLLFVAFFALYGNGIVLWRIARGNPRMAGGALTHVGFALVILGIISSSGFSRALPQQPGRTGEQSRDDFMVVRGETRSINGYQVTYTGQETTERGRTHYVLDFVDPQGRSFTVKPIVYKSNKDQWIQHPEVKMYAEKDVFVAVSPSAMYEDANDQQSNELSLARGEATTVGNQEYTIHFKQFDTNVPPEDMPGATEIAVAAVLDVTNLATGETRELRPVYIIKQDRSVHFKEARETDWNLGIAFTSMNVDNGRINLALDGVEVMPEDWLVVQAYEKPLISILWVGFLILMAGFGVTIYRRIQEVRLSVERGTL